MPKTDINKKLIITIDVEPDCDVHWNRSNPLNFNSVTYVIPEILRPLWDKFNINPIYFVDPEVIDDDQCCQMIKDEIKRGAIIGTHLHSEYVKPCVTKKPGKPSTEFPCYSHSNNIEFEKIKNLTNLIKKKLGIKPIWYRAARFGADLQTIKSLKKLGYKYDSSVTPGINWKSIGGPDHSNAPGQPYLISKNNYYKEAQSKADSLGIIEVPVTIMGKRFGFLGKVLPDHWLFYRWIRPTIMTFWEMKSMINNTYKKNPNSTLVMMFHSMELIPKSTPVVRTHWMKKMVLGRLKRSIHLILQLQDENCERYKTFQSRNLIKKNLIYYLCRKSSDKKILDYIKKIKKRKVLEVGIGGQYSIKNPLLKYINLNTNTFPEVVLKGNFDVILATFLTIYLSERQLYNFFKESKKVLNPSGQLIVTIPPMTWIGRLYMSVTNKANKAGHHQSPKQLSRMLGNVGYKKIQIIKLSSFLGIVWLYLIIASLESM